MPTSIGPYTVESELGRGGMGVVYRARGPVGEEVAIKVLLSGGAADPELVARFQREVGALSELDHPGILGVLGHGIERGLPYMVLELLQGQSLEQVLKAEGALPEARVIELGQKLADALAYAHSRGVVHRDLKPSNVMLRGGEPVVVDFGLVRLLGLDRSRLTETGAILGTPSYMAPEQARGEEAGPGADVYGVGATLYALLTGRPPFPESADLLGALSAIVRDPPLPPRRLRPELSPALEAVVLRCLGKEPGERYPSASALKEALLAAGAPEPPRQRSVQALALLSVVLAAAAVGALVGLTRPRGETELAQAAVVEGEAPATPAVDPPPLPPPPPPIEVTQPPANADPLTGELGALVARLRTLVQGGEDWQAVTEAEGALARFPESAELHAYWGMALGNVDRLEEAFRVADRAVELNPRLGIAYATRGALSYRLGRHDEALADFDRALELDPLMVECLDLRAEVRIAQQKWELVLEDLDRRLALMPSRQAIYRRGLALFELGRLDEADAAYSRACQLDPRDPQAWTSFAELRILQERYAEALDMADRALELGSRGGLASFARGKALRALERSEEALASFTRASRLMPTYPEPALLRSDTLIDLGRYEEALRELDRGLGMAHNATRYRRKRVALLSELGRVVEAVRDADGLIAEVPDDPRNYYLRGRLYQQLGRHREAVGDFERALALGFGAVGELQAHLADSRGRLKE